jgi:predicted transcriptional regulator
MADGAGYDDVVRKTIDIEDDLHRRLKGLARRRKSTMSRLANEAMRKFFATEEAGAASSRRKRTRNCS